MNKLTEFLKKINPSKFHLALIIGTIAVGILCVIIYNQYHKITLDENQIAALTDTVTVYKTKDGKNAAYIKIFKGTKAEALAATKSKDPVSYNIIKNTPGIHSLTNLSTETRIDTTSKVDTSQVLVDNKPVDPKNTSILITKEIIDPWYDAKVKVQNDSITLGLKIRNEFKIVAKDQNTGLKKLFKGSSVIIDVKNENPNTYTTGLSSYEFTPKTISPVKAGVIGAVIGAAVILILHK